MKINSHTGNYEVNFFEKLTLKDVITNNDDVIIVDKKMFNMHKNTFFKEAENCNIILIEAIEKSKTVDVVLKICNELAKKSIRRNGCIISVGGGIIQDISGFVACIYNRGLYWKYVPTTLLGQCDSCIGSKTSLNFIKYKNILGTFYPPKLIYIYPDFIKTLSNKDFYSGLGEVSKFSIMQGECGLKLLEDKLELLIAKKNEVLIPFVEKCLLFKRNFIEKDEFDKGERRLLNYGHTFAHALESASNNILPHGQAVSLGIIIANHIANNRKILVDEIKKRIEIVLRKLITVKLNQKWLDERKIMAAISKDKKRTNRMYSAILMNSDFVFDVFHDLNRDEIVKGVNYLAEFLQQK